MAIRVQDITRETRSAWVGTVQQGFLRAPSEETEEYWRPVISARGQRLKGAFDGERCVGTLRSFPLHITVPGGTPVEADAVTHVAVLPTHRRQGLMARMMTAELTEAVARGQALAVLDSAVWPIHGRFGFGPATSYCEFEIDCDRAVLRPDAAERIASSGGSVELVGADEYRSAAPAVHARFLPRQPGAVERPEHHWDQLSGRREHPGRRRSDPFFALRRDAEGTPTGALTYHIEDRGNWVGGVARLRLVVDDLIADTAADPAAAAALWQLVLAVDWVAVVATGMRAPDDPLPLLLTDARAARCTESLDLLWARILDVPAALEARTYQAEGAAILSVVDEQGLANGSYLLEGGLDGATCTRTTQEPDLTLPVSALGALYLGGESAQRLAAAGLVAEEWRGAAARIDTLFNTARLPWSPEGF